MDKGWGLKTALCLFDSESAMALEKCAGGVRSDIYEIRLYADRAVAFDTGEGLLFCLENGGVSSFLCGGMLILSSKEIYSVVCAAAGKSVFLKERELKSGYLTRNGIRVGVCGFSPDAVMFSEGISSVNIRIPCEKALLKLSEEEKALVKGARGLIVAGPPASGKTTFLKKCAAALSGGGMGRFYKTAIIDERDEFYSSLSPLLEVISADFIRGRTKLSGIETALRLLSPEYIICDEVGDSDEAKKMIQGTNSGVIFLLSMHAGNIGELKVRPQFCLLNENGVFDTAVFLSGEKKGQIAAVYKRGGGEL